MWIAPPLRDFTDTNPAYVLHHRSVRVFGPACAAAGTGTTAIGGTAVATELTGKVLPGTGNDSVFSCYSPSSARLTRAFFPRPQARWETVCRFYGVKKSQHIRRRGDRRRRNCSALPVLRYKLLILKGFLHPFGTPAAPSWGALEKRLQTRAAARIVQQNLGITLLKTLGRRAPSARNQGVELTHAQYLSAPTACRAFAAPPNPLMKDRARDRPDELRETLDVPRLHVGHRGVAQARLRPCHQVETAGCRHGVRLMPARARQTKRLITWLRTR